MNRRNGERRNESVAVAIHREKGSQHAMKWAMDNLMSRGQSITLLHVNTNPSSTPNPSGSHVKSQAKDVFLPFRCFCSRKDIKCNEVMLEDTDIAKALIDYVSSAAIETLVLGAPSRSLFVRTAEVTTSVSKGAPDYCTVYVIGKGKISSVRSASAPPPPPPPHLTQSPHPAPAVNHRYRGYTSKVLTPHCNLHVETEIRSPSSARGRNLIKFEPSTPESDISFLSSGRPSSSDTTFSSQSDIVDFGNPQLSSISDYENGSIGSSSSGDFSSQHGFSSWSEESGRTSHNMDDAEAEIRRLKQELKQTRDMYSAACREALSVKKKAIELQSRKMQEEQKKEETGLAEEATLSLAEKEKAKCKAAIEATQAAQRIAQLEAQKRMDIEMKGSNDEMTTTLNSFGHHLWYRKYTIEDIETATQNFSPSRKIGEGGYGPVYHCNMDHTPVAIKILRPDATQGQSQFQQEVEVLSCIRHPNMVLLLGACPEYGCLVYEYMTNGSLEDRLFRYKNTPVIPWQYRMTSAAGTFCYIDPEYQQTGMLGIKSDVYSLGIILLQIITAKPPMGLIHQVENAIENGTFAEILDPAVIDWPVEEALIFAKLALKCSEMRRRDRPDLGKVVLPHLNKLRSC
ncbi:Kinase protein with adenine nucleotide alpha hydrolases-like domain, putative isoform 2 [Hibiscus syriacus]|uniref:RING-type E3 ubiquitin transferase n=1 Tax=Hibiscus syriacus TaxID=106335 RepID=A0A6A3BBD8_HIBSY|nr:Kinase protein with adenine nucleotide alpha hydrolases-like domain, putative isoform 2 [Hibiscus syriacus]